MDIFGQLPGVRAVGGKIQITLKIEGKRRRALIDAAPTFNEGMKAYIAQREAQKAIDNGDFDIKNHFPECRANIKTIHCARATLNNLFDALLRDKYPDTHGDAAALRSERNAWGRYYEAVIGSAYPDELTTINLDNWISDIKLKPATKRVLVKRLRETLLNGYEKGLCSRECIERLPLVKVPDAAPMPLDIHEIDAMLNNLPGIVRSFYKLAIWTGLRTGEQCALTWSCIDFENRLIHVDKICTKGVFKDTKNKYSKRSIEMLPPVYDELSMLWKSSAHASGDIVFPNPLTGNPWRYQALGKHWERALKSCGLVYRPPYQTRHTFASIMLSAGLPLTWLHLQLGHSSYDTLEKIYARWDHSKASVSEWLYNKINGVRFTHRFDDFFYGITRGYKEPKIILETPFNNNKNNNRKLLQ